MYQPYKEIIISLTVSSVSGSGPSYTVTYLEEYVGNAKIGDKVLVEKREAGAGTGSTVLSTYTYIVIGVNDLFRQITMKYESDTGLDGDDSPADLYSGGGSSGSPQIADHKIVRGLAPVGFFME
jgi:hypothetical protein